MIFQRTWQQVMDGSKTSTRRPVKPGEEAEAGPTGAIERIRLVAIRQETLGDLTDEAAHAEGSASRADFFALWADMHGAADPAQPVWVLAFTLEEA
ncbi:MAG: hypothetical protein ACFB51_19850 [Anaerolineae bacterium]